MEASDGTFWFATMAGVTRYDPRTCSFKTFAHGGRPPRQEAMSLAQGRGGTIWVATQGGGVGAFDIRRNRWTWYSTADGLPTDEITSLMVDRLGRVWATPTTSGIAMFDGQRWRAYSTADGLSSGEIGRCSELRSGEIICGTYDHPLLQRFDGERWSQLRVDAPVGRHFYVHAVTETRSGDLWLATKGIGAIHGQPLPKSPGKTGALSYRWTVVDRSKGLISNRVGAIRQVKDGSLWFATSSGVSRYDGKRWQSFSRRDGLGANHVFAVTQASDGGIWFATLGGGVSRYGPSRWRTITEGQGLASDNLTGGVLIIGDALWVGTDRGVSVQRGGSWAAVPALAGSHVNHLLRTSDGLVWVATRDGVWRRTAAGWQVIEGSRGLVVNRLAEELPGKRWVATPKGVLRLDQQPDRTWALRDQSSGLPSRRVHDVLVGAKGTIWVATDNGVARRDGSRWTAFLSSAPASRTNRIYSLALRGSIRAGKIWASGLEGASSFDGRMWRPMKPSAWLPAGIYSRFVIATGDGSLWFAVRGLGVRRLHGARWSRFTSADGLAGDTVRDVAIGADGAQLFATLGGGLSVHEPERDPPQTFIGSLTPETGAPGAPSAVLQGEDLVLHFGGQDVLKETDTKDLLFSYRLDAGAWSPFSHSVQALFTRLSPGPHVFEVRAMDRDLNVDLTPAVHNFRVLRPWWAEPWLLALVGLLLALVIYAVIRILRAMARERAAVQREQATVNERRKFVRLASHELRKPLARLAHRAEVLTLPSILEDSPKIAEYAEAIVADSGHLSKLVETLLEQARIQEGGLQLELEEGDLVEVVQRTIGASASEEAAPRLEHDARSIQVRHDPFYLPLAIHNLLDNAAKYGGASEATLVRVSAEDERAILVVSDAGPGIPPEECERIFEPFFRGRTMPEHGGFGLGLSFARDIARAHGGDLTVRESESGGAAFCLWLPLI
jgi:signal transduction histidine kinase/streptogramin lyase